MIKHVFAFAAGLALGSVGVAVAQPGIPGWGGSRSSDDRMTCNVRHQDSRDRRDDSVIWLSITCR